MKAVITIEPVTPKNSAFGSAPIRYWRHGNFARAFVDGFPEDWRPNEDSSKRHPDDYRWQYLKVPCHGKRCSQCNAMGWDGTTHRLYYRGRRGKTLKAIRIGKLDGRWCWILTRSVK